MSEVMDLLKQANDAGSLQNYDEAIAIVDRVFSSERTTEEDYLANYIAFMTYLDKFPARMEEQDVSRWIYLPIEIIHKIKGYGEKVISCYENLTDEKKKEHADLYKDFKRLHKSFLVGTSSAEWKEKIDKVASKGCFIATAVYNSPKASEVVLLQEFRDKILNRWSMGKALINLYYRFSPAIARFLAHHTVLKKAIKIGFLDVVVWCVCKSDILQKR